MTDKSIPLSVPLRDLIEESNKSGEAVKQEKLIVYVVFRNDNNKLCKLFRKEKDAQEWCKTANKLLEEVHIGKDIGVYCVVTATAVKDSLF